MNLLTSLENFEMLDEERRDAAQRLDHDLFTVASAARGIASDAQETLDALRRRCVAVYRTALLGAAGVPHDRSWVVLEQTVAAFLACAGGRGAIDPAGRSAERRLRSLALS